MQAENPANFAITREPQVSLIKREVHVYTQIHWGNYFVLGRTLLSRVASQPDQSHPIVGINQEQKIIASMKDYGEHG